MGGLAALRHRCKEVNMTLEMIENTPYHLYDKIVLGLPGRDARLNCYRRTIQNIARAEILVLGLHPMPTGLWRNSFTAPTRGGPDATAFAMGTVADGSQVEWLADKEVRRKDYGLESLSSDQVWESCRIFLDAVLPVANEVELLLAQHPEDSPVDEIDGFAGVFTSPCSLANAQELPTGSPPRDRTCAWGPRQRCLEARMQWMR